MVIYASLHLQLDMTCCSGASVIVCLILGAVLLAAEGGQEWAKVMGLGFLIYAGVGIIYNICKWCTACCQDHNNSTYRQPTIDSHLINNSQPPYLLEPAEQPPAHYWPQQQQQQQAYPQEALRQTFHQQECTVCLDGFQPGELAARLDCGHKFHEACIVDWLEKQLNCPVCRQEIH